MLTNKLLKVTDEKNYDDIAAVIEGSRSHIDSMSEEAFNIFTEYVSSNSDTFAFLYQLFQFRKTEDTLLQLMIVNSPIIVNRARNNNMTAKQASDLLSSSVTN
jgi:hypothetical protein